jgi:hypothetical protein
MTRGGAAVVVQRGLALAGLLVGGAVVQAHSGPPFPILSSQVAGAYSISIWTDPDTTEDGKAAGQFWVMLEPVGGATAIPSNTQVRVTIRPLDRPGTAQTGQAQPVNGSPARQFIALLMDHEGLFGVRVAIDGPLGHAEVENQVSATYDLRPAPGLIALYVFPFLAVGALWGKVLLSRRRAGAPSPRGRR